MYSSSDEEEEMLLVGYAEDNDGNSSEWALDINNKCLEHRKYHTLMPN